MEREKKINPLMQQFDGMYAIDSYKSSEKLPEHNFTLRDNFAGLAMQGLLGNLSIQDKILAIKQRQYWSEEYPDKTESECIAIESFLIADAMLKQRLL